MWVQLVLHSVCLVSNSERRVADSVRHKCLPSVLSIQQLVCYRNAGFPFYIPKDIKNGRPTFSFRASSRRGWCCSSLPVHLVHSVLHSVVVCRFLLLFLSFSLVQVGLCRRAASSGINVTQYHSGDSKFIHIHKAHIQFRVRESRPLCEREKIQTAIIGMKNSNSNLPLFLEWGGALTWARGGDM